MSIIDKNPKLAAVIKDDEDGELNEHRETTAHGVVAVLLIHFLYFHGHFLLGNLIGSSLILFADRHFHRLDLCHFDLRFMLLYRKRKQNNLKSESKEKERQNIIVTRNIKAALHQIRKKIINKSHYFSFHLGTENFRT